MEIKCGLRFCREKGKTGLKEMQAFLSFRGS